MNSSLQPSGHLDSGSPHKSLQTLLEDVFSVRELFDFIAGVEAWLPSERRELRMKLPEEADRATVMSRAVALFSYRGLIRDELFLALERARPGHRERIWRVAQDVLRSPGEAPPASITALEPQVLLGHYRLLEPAGEGSVGSVWKALDETGSRLVALKFLHGSRHVLRNVRRANFFRGARLVAELEHASLVSVLDPRCEYAGHDFYVMEFVDGPSLHQAVLAGLLPPGRVVGLLRELGAGLAHAHARDLVHGDVSPKNVILAGGERPKLVDFDLVRDFRRDQDRGTEPLGTFVYSAPESLDPKLVGPRADIYSLAMVGVFAYHRRPLGPECYGQEALTRFIRQLDCPRPIRRALARACQHDPAKRFATMHDFCVALSAEDRFDWRAPAAVASVLVGIGGVTYAVSASITDPPTPLEPGAETRPASPADGATPVVGPTASDGTTGSPGSSSAADEPAVVRQPRDDPPPAVADERPKGPQQGPKKPPPDPRKRLREAAEKRLQEVALKLNRPGNPCDMIPNRAYEIQIAYTARRETIAVDAVTEVMRGDQPFDDRACVKRSLEEGLRTLPGTESDMEVTGSAVLKTGGL